MVLVVFSEVVTQTNLTGSYIAHARAPNYNLTVLVFDGPTCNKISDALNDQYGHRANYNPRPECTEPFVQKR